MKVEDFLSIDGIREKSANKLYNAIQVGYKKSDIILLFCINFIA